MSENELRRSLIDVAASLAAAISLLERAPATIAPSKKMFDQMKVDYRASLDRARDVLNVLPRPPAADAGEVREKAWATDDDPIADLAIKLAARATALEEAHGEWTWRDIAKCAVDALAPSQTFADGIEAAAKLVRDRATFWRSRRGRCSASLEAECIDLAAAIRKLGS